VFCAAGTFAASAKAMPAKRAFLFVNSIGVNVRLSTDSKNPYSNSSDVNTSLRKLGISHIRTSLPASASSSSQLRAIAAHGIKVSLIGTLGNDSSNPTANRVASLIDANFRSITEAIEGPNEWDIFFEGGDRADNTRIYQRRLYAAVKRRPRLKRITVLGPSYAQIGHAEKVGPLFSAMDAANLHPYAAGFPPEWVIGPYLDTVFGNRTKRPAWATEVGYHNSFQPPYYQAPASERASSSYLVRMLADNFRVGVTRSYMWQLLDTPVPTGYADQEGHFGILRRNFAEKPAATTIRRTITALRDSAKSFTPTSLPLTLTKRNDLKSLLLQKRNGTHYLLLWRSVAVWAPKREKSLRVKTVPIHIRIAQRTRLSVMNPAGDGLWHRLPAPNRRATVKLKGDLVILRIA
jgi:hypothetical protein